MSAPVVGVTASREEASWGHWSSPALLAPAAYVEAITAAGGLAVLLVPEDREVAEVVARLDALVLSGGADMDPAAYGAAPHPSSGAPQPGRDAAELAYLRAGAGRDLPVLGICRGMQVMNVARGGTLLQHLPDVVGHDGHRPTPGVFATHQVSVEAGSRLASIVGTRCSDVPTHHHQGLDRLGDGLRAVAWAGDGTIEAVEDPRATFLLGVQWHPEAGADLSLFSALVAAAAQGRRALPADHDNREASNRPIQGGRTP